MNKETYSIVGTAFVEGGEQIMATLATGDVLSLVREPTNRFDPNAIAVYAGKNRIGYIPRKKNAVLCQFIDQEGEPQMAMDGAPKAIRGKFVRSPNSGFPMVGVGG